MKMSLNHHRGRYRGASVENAEIWKIQLSVYAARCGHALQPQMLSMTLVSTEMYYQFVYWIEVTFMVIQWILAQPVSGRLHIDNT